jgi:GNAT superfamily N-acetyltransferase
MSLAVRLFQPSDLPRLQTICATVFGGNDYLPKNAMAYHSDPLLRTSLFVGVMEGESEICCTSAVKLIDAGSAAYVFGGRVSEEARGRGLGKAILKASVQEAFVRGATRVFSTHNSNNSLVPNMIGGLGFQPFGVWPLIRRQREGVAHLLQDISSIQDCAEPAVHRPASAKELCALFAALPDDGERELVARGSIVLLAAWMVCSVAYLNEQAVHAVLVDLDSTGKLKAFSVATVGTNGALGNVHCVFLSRAACIKRHLQSHLVPLTHCQDVEVYCDAGERARQPQLLARNNMTTYANSDVVVSTVSRQSAKL